MNYSFDSHISLFKLDMASSAEVAIFPPIKVYSIQDVITDKTMVALPSHGQPTPLKNTNIGTTQYCLL